MKPRFLRRFVALTAVLLMAGSDAASAACETKSRQVEKTIMENYEVWGMVPQPNYGWVWAKTGTTDVWEKTGTTTSWGVTSTKTDDVYDNLYRVIAHTNVYQYSERVANKTFTYTLTSAQFGLEPPFYCTGSWYRWPNTSTWLNDIEPDCGGHVKIKYNNNEYFWQGHNNVYQAGGTVSVKTGTKTTDVYGWVTADTYGWVTKDVYGWVTKDVYGLVWAVVSFTNVNTLLESGTRPKVVLVWEDYESCIRPT